MHIIKIIFIFSILIPISSYGLAGFAEKRPQIKNSLLPPSAKRPNHILYVENKKVKCYLPAENSLIPPWLQGLPPQNPLNARKFSSEIPLCGSRVATLLRKQAPKMVLKKSRAGHNQVAGWGMLLGGGGCFVLSAMAAAEADEPALMIGGVLACPVVGLIGEALFAF